MPTNCVAMRCVLAIPIFQVLRRVRLARREGDGCFVVCGWIGMMKGFLSAYARLKVERCSHQVCQSQASFERMSVKRGTRASEQFTSPDGSARAAWQATRGHFLTKGVLEKTPHCKASGSHGPSSGLDDRCEIQRSRRWRISISGFTSRHSSLNGTTKQRVGTSLTTLAMETTRPSVRFFSSIIESPKSGDGRFGR